MQCSECQYWNKPAPVGGYMICMNKEPDVFGFMKKPNESCEHFLMLGKEKNDGCKASE